MEGVKPKVRGSGLLVQQLGDELLIYDLERNEAHCLNGIAASVWALCDGERTVAEIGRLLSTDLAPADVEVLVWCALDQFAERDLLEEEVGEEPDRTASAMMTRRQMVARLGLAVGLALPLVESIVSPPAAMAQSGTTGNTGITGQAAAANSLAEALRGLWHRLMD
jgi:hypothetical protein